MSEEHVNRSWLPIRIRKIVLSDERSAELESVGFRDARIEKLSESKELNFLLVPFLSRKLPAQMKVNAAELMRKLLSESMASTGYSLTLRSLKLHSMLVEHEALVVDVDAGMSVE